MASSNAAFRRFTVVANSFVFPCLAATVEVVLRVADQPLKSESFPMGNGLLRRSVPVSSESDLLVHAPAGGPDPALLRPTRDNFPEVGAGLLTRRLVGEQRVQRELAGKSREERRPVDHRAAWPPFQRSSPGTTLPGPLAGPSSVEHILDQFEPLDLVPQRGDLPRGQGQLLFNRSICLTTSAFRSVAISPSRFATPTP